MKLLSQPDADRMFYIVTCSHVLPIVVVPKMPHDSAERTPFSCNVIDKRIHQFQ